MGTFRLLEAARAYWAALPATEKRAFRFLQISTDEVYGALEPNSPPFTEQHCYWPSSPYAASKAAADHLAYSYYHTYGLPVLTSNCSNNYGPHQYPEKLIPLLLNNALAGKLLPLYGNGQQVRDWLYVTDHCRAIRTVLQRGLPGETYNIGGCNEMTNLEVAHILCALLDELRPRADGLSYSTLISFVKDRPGHDPRYAIDARKIRDELGWQPRESFATGIRKTVRQFLETRS